MKYCPTCQSRYDEEELRFCMKDGTPLVEEDVPNFVQMPSEVVDESDEDDPGEITIIRRNPVNVPPPPDPDEDEFVSQPPHSERIVVPTIQDTVPEQRLRVTAVPARYEQPRQNTAKVVFLTVLGTLAVLGIFAAGVYMLRNDRPQDGNLNINTSMPNLNTNLETNSFIDGNFNLNTNFNTNTITNINTNSNINVNVRTPTPTPRPSPSASASPSQTPDDDPTPVPTRSPVRTPIPTPEPTIIRPGALPSPRQNPSPPERELNGM